VQVVEQVVVTDEGVTRQVRRRFRKNIDERIAWSDLHRVEVVSWFSVTARDDGYFLLIDDNERGVAVGASDALATGLLRRLQELPGFDHKAAIEAAGAQMRAVLWTRNDDAAL
jgi:hypothetical protein